MKVQNVNYDKLVKDENLGTAFRAEVMQSVAAEADPGFPPSRVNVKLRPGSVLVDAEIAELTPGTAAAITSRLNGSASLGQRVTNSVKAIQGIDSVSTGDVVVTNIAARVKSPPSTDGFAAFEGEVAKVERDVENNVQNLVSNLSGVPPSALAAGAASSFLCLAICLIGCFLVTRPRGQEGGKGYLLAPDEDLENVDKPPTPKKEESATNIAPPEEQRTETLPLLTPDAPPQPEQPSEIEPPTPAVPADNTAENKVSPQPKPKARRKKAGPKGAAAKKEADKKEGGTPEKTEPKAAEQSPASSSTPGRDSSRSKNSGDKRADAAYASYVRLAEDMGFPESQASVALAEAGGNSATALDKLLAQP